MGKKMYNEEECHKKFAVDLFNYVWSLLVKQKRTEEEDEGMVNASHASCFHWSKVGIPVNLQRGEWLISHVYAVLNRAEPALHHAKICLRLTEEHKFRDFDLAYAYEGMARALAVAGNKGERDKYINLAKEAGEAIKEKEDKELFFSDLKSIPGYHND